MERAGRPGAGPVRGRGRAPRGAVATLALAALVACTPSGPPDPTPTATPTTPAPSPTATPLLPGFPTDGGDPAVPAVEPVRRATLRWADGTEVEGVPIDTGTALRAGPDALTVLERLTVPGDRSLAVLDVAADGTVLVAERGTADYDEDGNVVEGSAEPTVVRVVGPQGERVLTTDAEHPEDVYTGRLLADGSAVWFGIDVTGAGRSRMYRAPAGSSRGVEVPDVEGAVVVLDDGVVLVDGTVRAWDGTTRDLGLPPLENTSVVPARCDDDPCPFVLSVIRGDDVVLHDVGGGVVGMPAPADNEVTVSLLEDGVLTHVVTIDGYGSAVAAYGSTIVVEVHDGGFDASTWILDVADRSARWISRTSNVALAGSRLVWGSLPSTWTGLSPERNAPSDLHTLDLATGELTRVLLDENVFWLQAAGDVIAWNRLGADGGAVPEAIVARLPTPSPSPTPSAR